MNKIYTLIIVGLGITKACFASTTYLTCGPNDAYSKPPAEITAVYQIAPYNIVYGTGGSTALNVGLWNGVYYMPNYPFKTTIEAYNFCNALLGQCQPQGGNPRAWTNLSGFEADIFVQVPPDNACPVIIGGGALCKDILQDCAPSTPYYELGCADATNFKPSGAPTQQELQTYGTLIQNNNNSTWLEGTLLPNSAAPKLFQLANTFASSTDASTFCNTLSAQCKAQFPKGNGSVGVYSPGNNVTPYPLSVTFLSSGQSMSADCPYFPP